MALKNDKPIIFHFRKKGEQGQILPRGGLTLAFNPTRNCFGYAICSKKDNFYKRLAVNMAVGRSKARYALPREKRTASLLTPAKDLGEVRKIASEIAENLDRSYEIGLGLGLA